MTDPGRLDSWKEIARFLGRDVRTVRRWEQRGLPVHRIPGGTRGRVFAYSDELARWLEHGGAAAEPKDHPRFLRWPHWAAGIAATTIAIGALVVGWSLTHHVSRARRLLSVESDLVALDVADNVVWTYSRTAAKFHPPPKQWFRIADLGDEQGEQVVAAVNISRPPLTELDGELFRFHGDGKVMWSATVKDRLAFRAGEYGPPWSSDDFAIYHADGGTRIAWAVHHYLWWPSLLVTMNAQGERLGTFINSGWIRSVVQSPDRRYLLVAGVTNSHQSYFVAVLDANQPSGHSPEPAGSPTECINCPAGRPLRYIVFPRTDVSREQPFPAEGPSVETTSGGMMHVHVRESGSLTPAVSIYSLSSDLEVTQLRFSDLYWDWHRRLEAEGRLRHPADECPYRRGPHVQVWSRDSGWRTVTIATR